MKENHKLSNKQIFEFNFQEKKLIFEIDQLVNSAERSVLCRYGNTTVLTNLYFRDLTSSEFSNFLHLSVFFEEKFYAVGRIPGNFNRREGKPSYESITTARLIDRSLRSFFSKKIQKEIQISNIVLSLDKECDPRIVACWNSNLVAFLCPELVFNIPLATISIAKSKKGEIIINHINKEINNYFYEVIVTATEEEKIVMLEVISKEIEEEELIKILQEAQIQINLLISFFKKISIALGIKRQEQEKQISKKETFLTKKEENFIKKKMNILLEEIIDSQNIWIEKEKRLKKICSQVFNELTNNDFFVSTPENIQKFVELTYREFIKKKMNILLEGKGQRLDGRGVDDIRSLNIQLDYLPSNVGNVHASALFSRGDTKVLSILTLDEKKKNQLIDNISGYFHKYFFTHYNFHDFSPRNKSVSRREIGHGQLVEKTFIHLLPSHEDFPYTKRIVSEAFSSDGSSSQASICASSLALMVGGVPLIRPVAGVSLGLFKGKIFDDINRIEDDFGEVDCKIARTKKGICSSQLDVKNHGISYKILKEILERGKKSLLSILKTMERYISHPRLFLPIGVPKYKKIYIGENKLSAVVGRGGKNINFLIKETGITIDLQPDGYLLIYHLEEKQLNKAIDLIQKLTENNKKF